MTLLPEQHAQIELEHIALELRHGREHHLRHFVDQYYCYKHGFINASGIAKWEAILWKGYVSVEARKTRQRDLVVKEHVVPLRVIRQLLVQSAPEGRVDLTAIAAILDQYVRFATITQKEDKKLREAGLKSDMPPSFYDADDALHKDLFARYRTVGIDLDNDVQLPVAADVAAS